MAPARSGINIRTHNPIMGAQCSLLPSRRSKFSNKRPPATRSHERFKCLPLKASKSTYRPPARNRIRQRTSSRRSGSSRALYPPKPGTTIAVSLNGVKLTHRQAAQRLWLEGCVVTRSTRRPNGGQSTRLSSRENLQPESDEMIQPRHPLAMTDYRRCSAARPSAQPRRAPHKPS